MDAEALSTLPLPELVSLACAGDASAEAQLCQRFVPAVRAFARRRLRSNDAVDEFTQDVFLAFLPALRRGAVEQPERVGGFLLGICRNLAREGARQTARRRELWDTHGAVLLEFLPRELRAPTLLELKLEDCMSSLSARARRLLELSYVDDLSHEEIAQKLDVTPANARVMRHRSLEHPAGLPGRAADLGSRMSKPKAGMQLFDDYLSGVLPGEEADAFEQALFEGEHAEEAAFFDDFRRGMRFAARFGPIGQSATAESLARLRSEGVQIHLIELSTESVGVIEPWEEGFELVVTRLGVDARGYDHVDVQVEVAHDGTLIKIFHDVGCDPLDGNIYALCEEPLARAAFLEQPQALIARVLGERDGQQTEIAVLRSTND